MRWLIVFLVVPLMAFTQTGGEPGAQQGEVARGEQIYQANCAMCHGVEATGMMGMHPALTGVVDRLSAEGVEVTVRKGRNTNPPMPAFGDRLDDDDIIDLLAYLESLPAGPRNFGPEMMDRSPANGGSTMGRDGMGGMMDRTLGGPGTALWIAVLLLTAAVAGIIGYLAARRRPVD